jgi:hypothetical protein
MSPISTMSGEPSLSLSRSIEFGNPSLSKSHAAAMIAGIQASEGALSALLRIPSPSVSPVGQAVELGFGTHGLIGAIIGVPGVTFP